MEGRKRLEQLNKGDVGNMGDTRRTKNYTFFEKSPWCYSHYTVQYSGVNCQEKAPRN